MIIKYCLFLIIFLTLFVNLNLSYAQESEVNNSKNKLLETFHWFDNHPGIAQWFVVSILAISAILVLQQIKTQNTISKGQNFLELIKIVTTEDHIQSLDLICTEYQKNPDIFKKKDSEMPEHIRKAVLRIKNNYHSIGLMLFAKMFGESEFLKFHSREARDAWEILNENYEIMNNERNKNRKKPEEYYRGFKFVGLASIFWLDLSFLEKLWVAEGYIGTVPGTLYYNFRTSLKYLFNKIYVRINKKLIIKTQKSIITKIHQIKNIFLKKSNA